MRTIDIEKTTIIADRNFSLINSYLANKPLFIGLCLSIILTNPLAYYYFSRFRPFYLDFMKDYGFNSLISENANIGLLYFLFIIININSIIALYKKKPVLIFHVSNSVTKNLKTWGMRIISILMGLFLFYIYYISLFDEQTCTAGCYSAIFKSHANNFLLQTLIFTGSQVGIFLVVLPFFVFPIFCRKQ